MTDKTKEQCRVASQTIADIEFLSKREEFTNLMKRFKTRADELADEILHNDTLTDAARNQARHKRDGIMEVLETPKLILEGGRKFLAANMES